MNTVRIVDEMIRLGVGWDGYPTPGRPDHRPFTHIQELRVFVDRLAAEVPIILVPRGRFSAHCAGSYGLKHALERRLGFDVSTGEAILAAEVAGFIQKRGVGRDNPNTAIRARYRTETDTRRRA